MTATNGLLSGIKGLLTPGSGKASITYKGVEHEYGSFDDTLDTKLIAKQEELKTTLDTIKSQFSSLTTSLSGTGGLPVFQIGNFRGQNIVVDFNHWRDALQPLSNAFYFMFVLAAAFVLLGS